MNRRKFSKMILGLLGAGALAGLYAWQIEPFWVEIVRLAMPIQNLPPELEGKTLMQLSDLHVGNRFDRNFLARSMQEAQALQPDFVVYTGDFVSYDSPEQFAQLEEVLASAVRGKLATLGILGNHDYGKNWAEADVAERIVAIAEKAGISMLRNAQKEAAGLTFTGLDDLWGRNFKPETATALLQPQAANVVLCHNPDAVDLPIWNGYRGWILAGHTHGGQCKPPFLPPPMLPVKNRRYSAGQIDLGDGRTLYINRALGHLWQVRFNVRPEITVFTLTRA